MTRTNLQARTITRSAIGVAAFGLTAAALVSATPLADTTASASELEQTRGFDEAFAPYTLPETHEILSPAERLEAETLSAAAPREVARPVSKHKAKPSGKRIRSGHASYYGARFAGRRTANGEIFNPSRLTAAHRTLPFGSKVRVTNRRNGKSVVVRINDRGPFAKGRVIDLSKAAAGRIGLIHAGHGPVELALLD